MASLLLLVVCLALGHAVVRWGRPPDGLVHALNWWVIEIALPALILALVPHVAASAALWFLVVPQWLGLAGAYVVFARLGPRLGWSPQRTGAVTLVAGLANTSFVGFPLLEALRGPGVLGHAVVADQLGAFVALSVGGALVAARYSDARPGVRPIARKVLTFPPLLALLVAIAVGLLGGWPREIEDVLARIGATLSPLAVFSVGLRLRLRVARAHALPMLLALAWKLLVVPLAAWGVALAAGVTGPILVIGVLQAAMGPMISAAILAEREGLDGELANAILALGIVLAFGTVALFSVALPG